MPRVLFFLFLIVLAAGLVLVHGCGEPLKTTSTSPTTTLVIPGVSGKIRNSSGTPVSGISVFLTSVPTHSATSDTSGNYSIGPVAPGTYEVRTRDVSLYASSAINVTVGSGQTTSGNITLTDRFSLISETITQDPVSGSGTVMNNGTTEAKGVTGTYVFYDSDGTILGTGIATIGNISSAATKSFVLLITGIFSSYSSVARTFAAASF